MLQNTSLCSLTSTTTNSDYKKCCLCADNKVSAHVKHCHFPFRLIP